MATALAIAGVGATVGSAVIGSRASSKAADSARAGQDKAFDATSAAANSARNDVNSLFGKSADIRRQTFGDTADFLNQSIGRQIQPFQEGNMAAQEQVSSALPQINNAIMGNPVDFSGFAPKQISQPSDFTLDFSAFRKKAPVAAPAGQTGPTNQNLLQSLQIGRFGNLGDLR